MLSPPLLIVCVCVLPLYQRIGRAARRCGLAGVGRLRACESRVTRREARAERADDTMRRVVGCMVAS